jgi:hypothetical protein
VNVAIGGPQPSGWFFRARVALRADVRSLILANDVTFVPDPLASTR